MTITKEELEAALRVARNIIENTESWGLDEADFKTRTVKELEQAARTHLRLLKAIDDKRLAVVPCEASKKMIDAGMVEFSDIQITGSKSYQRRMEKRTGLSFKYSHEAGAFGIFQAMKSAVDQQSILKGLEDGRD